MHHAGIAAVPDNASNPAPGPQLELRLDSPFAGREWNSRGFLGAWSPDRPLRVTGSGLATACHGEHWFLLAATQPDSGMRVHADATGTAAVAFDGYVVDPPLHQGAPSDVITGFWRRARRARVNGQFAAAVIDPVAGELSLRTDPFGFTPLYYREFAGAVLFATHADFLVDPATRADDVTLVSVINHSTPPANRTMFADIHRVPLGGCLTFSRGSGKPVARRFDLDVAGSGIWPATRERLIEIDAIFRRAVERGLELNYGVPILSLSSGLDSRRILGKLLAAGQRPSLLTVRVLLQGHLDLDGPVAAAIARSCGLAHRILELPDAARHAHDCDLRRQAVGAETQLHDWFMVLQRALPEGPATVFSGFLGDTVDDSQHPWDDMFRDPHRDLECFVSQYSANPARDMLAVAMNRSDELADVLRDYLEPYSDLRHAADLADMVLAMRRGTATGIQLMQPRHLEVRPFLDLDYLQAIMEIDPHAKADPAFRRGLLASFHPELADFGGSAASARAAIPVRTRIQRMREHAYLARIAGDVSPRRQQELFQEALSPRGRVLATLTRLAPRASGRWHWAMRPILEAILHRERTPAVWQAG